VILSGVTGILFCIFAALPVAALSVSDYFTYSYNFAFSKTNISGSEVFIVTVTGNATCVNNLPMTVSAADIVSKVIARNTQTGADVVLNSIYSIGYDNAFPNHTGQTASVTVQVPLSFPSGSVSGSYNIIGVLSDAHILVSGISFSVKEYLPSTQAMGSITYTAPSTGGGIFVPPATPPTTTTTTTTTAATTASTTTPSTVPSSTTTTISTTPSVTSTSTASVVTTTATTTTIQLPVQSTAAFMVSDLQLAPAVVKNGKTVKITALLSNTGDLAGTYEMVMQIDGQYVNSQSIVLAGKSSQTVTFTHLINAEGQHFASIGTLTKSFIVEPAPTDYTRWWIIGGLAGFCIGGVIGGGALFVYRLKKYRR
jgi:hypothetical protein